MEATFSPFLLYEFHQLQTKLQQTHTHSLQVLPFITLLLSIVYIQIITINASKQIMGLKQFRIEFTHPGPSVFASQTLYGKVVLEVTQDKAIESLEVLCSGKGKVHWKETPRSGGPTSISNTSSFKKGIGGRKNSSTKRQENGTTNSQTIMSVEENYIEEKVLLLEKKNCDDKLFVEKGTQEYTFEFQIPSSSPSSFQGPYGDVKYFIEARLTRPKRKLDHVIKIPFTVNGLLDLNKETRLSNSRIPPVENFATELRKFTKTTSNFLPCFICKINKGIASNQVGFHLRLHKSIFVPGEYVQFSADMRNMSPTDVSGVTLSLIQETNYWVGDKCRTGYKHSVATAKGPSVASWQSEIWETNPTDSLFLQIPSIPPTNLGTSNIIEVKYFLQLEMEFYGQKNIKGQLPILIGSIPLKSVFRDFVNLKRRNDSEKTETNDGIIRKPFGRSIGYPDLPSPTYEEAVCFTQSLDFSSLIIGNGLQHHPSEIKSERIQVLSAGGGSSNDNLSDVDSDEEYLAATGVAHDKCNMKYDDKYVPLYAKYPTVYNFDG